MWVDEIHNVHSSAKVKLSFPPFNSSLSLPPGMLLFFFLLNLMVGQIVPSPPPQLFDWLFICLNSSIYSI